ATVPGGAGNVQDIYPLAPLQEGILFHHLMEQEGDPYLLPSLYAFSSRTQLDELLQAMQQVIDRHDILRTSLVWEGPDQPVQVVHRHAQLPVQELHFDASIGDVAAQLQAQLDPKHTRIDIGQAPLLRCHLAEDPQNGRWLLHILAHHLAIDHTTLDLLVAEAEAIDQGLEASLPAPVPFRQFVAQAKLGVSQAEHEAFFTQLLGDVDEPTAPFGLLDVQGEFATMSRRLPAALSRAVRQQARRAGVSVASLMHLAWALVLARSSGRDDVVFGTVLFGRMQGGEGNRGIGLFINTLPIRLHIGQQGALQALKDAHALLAQLLRHEHATLAQVQRCSGVVAPTPLFSGLLNYRYSPQAGQGSDDADAGVESLGVAERTNYPLCVDIDDLGTDFLLTAQVVEGISPSRICDFLEHAITALVAALADTPAVPLLQLDVLPAAEREQVVVGWNQTYQDLPLSSCVQELFEARVAAAPDAIALVQPDL
ncbi:Condensation domain-containing protein, partial [Andreprevotia lacus DSM 23236]